MTITTLLVALLFAGVHLFVGRLRALEAVPRSGWLSAAGGVAVAYVFLHLLPELAEHREVLGEALGGGAFAERVAFAVALLGLATFYGLERAAKLSRGRAEDRGGADVTDAGTFWIHIGAFGVYNLLIGYLLVHREEPGWWALVVYAVAMGLHFVTNDFGLREDHKHRYDRTGRWLLGAAVLAGWLAGLTVEVPEWGVALLFAFLAGGVTLNVLKEELPEERRSRFGAFAAGAGAYAALLLLL